MSHVIGHPKTVLDTQGRGRGRIAQLDPRMRILVAAGFAIAVVALSALPPLIAALAVSFALLAASGLPARETVKRMILMDGFIIFMLILLPFTMPGDPIFTLWGFPASWQGLWRAVDIALTANAVILALMALVGTLEPVTLGHALHRLRCPESLVLLLMFTIRYIDVLREEYLRLRVAMKLRGFIPRSTWHTYRSMGYLVGMMLVRAIERSERILAAMKCRGFSGKMLLLQDFKMTRSDWGFATLMIATCACLLILDRV